MRFLKIFCEDRKKALRILENPHFKNEFVNQRSETGWTCVHQTSVDGDVNALHKLIEHGANMWLKDSKLLYPIHYAIHSSHYAILQLILFYKIPEEVVTCFMETFGDFFIRSALNSSDLRIPKLLVDKFFRRIKSKNEIRNIVHNALRRENAYDIISKVFDWCEKVLETLREGICLDTHLGSTWPCPRVVDYLMKAVDTMELPLIVDGRFISQSTNEVLEMLLRHADKLSGLNSPDMLFYAVKSHSLYAVDLLLSLGCNPYAVPRSFNSSCFFEVLTDSFNSQHNPLPLAILHKILLYYGYRKSERPVIVKNVSHNFAFWMYELNDFRLRTLSNFYNNVTLFDILYYRIYIEELREKFIAA